MRDLSCGERHTSFITRLASCIILGLLAASFVVTGTSFAANAGPKRSAMDALCATYNFSSVSGPGKPFQSITDAQAHCQKLIDLGVKVENIRTLLDNADFHKAFLNEIDGISRVLFGPGKGGPATDSFCASYNFSSIAGSGKPFQSITDAQESCQKLVPSAMYVTNLRSLLDDTTFREQYLNEIESLNRNFVFSSPVQEVNPQITIAGTCTNPNAATLQSQVAKSVRTGTRSIQEQGTFDVTTKVFHYQLSQTQSCTYSALWNFSNVPALSHASGMTKCLLAIPYPGGLTYQQNNDSGSTSYQQVSTQKVPLFIMQVPGPLQSLTARLDLSAGLSVNVSAIYFRCFNSPEHP